MLRLTEAQRAVLVQVFPAAANLALGAMVFGQFLRQQSFSSVLALSGIAFWIAFISLTLTIARGNQ
jgi:hypothetical protein